MSAISTNFVQKGPTFGSALWLTGVFFRLGMTGLLFALTLTQSISFLVFALIVTGDLISFIWSIGRYNGASNSHLNSTGRFWAVTGGYVFFILAFIVMIVMWWLMFQVTEFTPPSKNMGRDEIEQPHNNLRFVIETSPNKKQTTFKGVIASSAADEVAHALDGANGTATLVLRSGGGNVYVARDMASNVLQRGADTRVVNECSASCVLVFLAGANRTLGPGAQLGLHAYGLDYEQVLPHVVQSRERREDQQFFLQRGVSLAFVEKAFAADRDAIWYPSRQELIKAGVITDK